MGVWTRTVASLDAGDSTDIKAPTGTSGIHRVYVTSTNLTYITLKTDNHLNTLGKSADTTLNGGYYTLDQEASEITITAFGMSSAENVTVYAEWV